MMVTVSGTRTPFAPGWVAGSSESGSLVHLPRVSVWLSLKSLKSFRGKRLNVQCVTKLSL